MEGALRVLKFPLLEIQRGVQLASLQYKLIYAGQAMQVLVSAWSLFPGNRRYGNPIEQH